MVNQKAIINSLKQANCKINSFNNSSIEFTNTNELVLTIMKDDFANTLSVFSNEECLGGGYHIDDIEYFYANMTSEELSFQIM